MTFDSRLPGTSVDEWEAVGIRDAPTLSLDGVGSLVVVAAHPDDETLGAGGLLARAADAGIPTRVVLVTDGGADGDPGTPAARAAELRAALAELGPIGVEELGFPDGGVLDDRDAVGEAIARTLGEEPDDALLVAPWAGDGHRDHRVVGELVSENAGGRRVLGYPIWAWHWDDPAAPALPRDRMLAIEIDAERKRRGIRRFTSQLVGDDPMLRPDFVAHFELDREVFVETAGHGTLPAGYFDDMYARRDDPWSYRDRWYEERKRDATIAALTRRRYGRALEIGSSIGILTERLADRCDDLLAIDVAERAVAAARERVGDRARVEQRDATRSFPEGPFDLLVLSEVGYYFGDALDATLDAAHDALAPDGELLACHWRHPVADYPLGGDEVHARIARLGLTRLVRHEEEDFLLEVWSHDATSVAHREGLS